MQQNIMRRRYEIVDKAHTVRTCHRCINIREEKICSKSLGREIFINKCALYPGMKDMISCINYVEV